jgi:hypothetical protein
LLTHSDAAAAGLTIDQMRQRVRSGRWQRISTGVYRIAGAPPSKEQSALAAVLRAGATAVSSHLTALALVGIGEAPPTPHITVPRGAGTRTPHAVVHRSAIAPIDRAKVGVIPSTTPARALVDVAALVTSERLADLVDEVLCIGLAQPAAILSAVRRSQHAKGRKGVPMLLEVLQPWLDGIRPGSPAELRLLRRIEGWGLPTPTKQHRVTDEVGRLVAVLDLAWPALLVGLEYDGALHHTPRRLAHDVAREERVRSLGWFVERADRHDVAPSSTRLRDVLVSRLLQPAA